MARYTKTTATVLGGQIGTAITGAGHVTFIPVISYRYEVDGQIYNNNRFTQNTVGRRNKNAIQKILNEYPQNATIEIFYNETDPADAFIQKGFGGGINFGLRLVAVVALLVLIAFLIYARSQGLI